ncbi:hypothetical protein D3C81_1208900 [compost metagenome]
MEWGAAGVLYVQDFSEIYGRGTVFHDIFGAGRRRVRLELREDGRSVYNHPGICGLLSANLRGFLSGDLGAGDAARHLYRQSGRLFDRFLRLDVWNVLSGYVPVGP